MTAFPLSMETLYCFPSIVTVTLLDAYSGNVKVYFAEVEP